MQGKPHLIFDGPKNAPWTIVLAHGAGAGIHTPFMNAFAAGLAGRGIRRSTRPGVRDATIGGKSGHNPLSEANSLPRVSSASPVPGEGLIRAPNRSY
jgi:predicted alpha/beta-hydrolase family hydrolase